MIDASHHGYEENVAITKSVCEYAHERGVSVEAELGTLGGIEEDISGVVQLTDPEQCVDFCTRTGVDALAVAIGTSHGAYKFTSTPTLAMDLINEIREKTGVPLVMHGSSEVPAHLREEIIKYGGHMPNAMGVPTPMVVEAISRGICKINIDSDSRMAVTASIRKMFTEKPEVFDPRAYMGPARQAQQELLVEKMNAYGTSGHAQDYECVSLEDAKKWYA
ncbi:ketose-bisphosphate aldolase, class-II [Kipferlia bialata]|nr:ketose-bisphosphate aldolase, class-II [Kipferlia bialata]|eukprot:g1445.t1